MQNIVILAGNIGQKPEVRSTQSGTKITNFTLATSRPRLSEGRVMRDENGYRVMDTEWHRITCFNGLGKTVAEHCEKGMKVLVHGRIHYTKWTDATGTDRYGCEIIAEKVDFLSRPKSAEGESPDLVDRDDPVAGLAQRLDRVFPGKGAEVLAVHQHHVVAVGLALGGYVHVAHLQGLALGLEVEMLEGVRVAEAFELWAVGRRLGSDGRTAGKAGQGKGGCAQHGGTPCRARLNGATVTGSGPRET